MKRIIILVRKFPKTDFNFLENHGSKYFLELKPIIGLGVSIVYYTTHSLCSLGAATHRPPWWFRMNVVYSSKLPSSSTYSIVETAGSVVLGLNFMIETLKTYFSDSETNESIRTSESQNIIFTKKVFCFSLYWIKNTMKQSV